ncbi:Phosphotransferase enzyme family protein [Marinobacter sp. LV10R510-11A]|uniref:phosphotransferase n=1 Tax=Marinobacter sp. LV10R510-11A TaxID=1415568 RepID=UPI000BB902DC|nr:phosphotransferase [Marinobacter sp. LV10R510-11A]SOB75163.1 Phosphotransferase enzyme family protein [Marinobacter sp. LV10R510-11A]
MSLSNAKVHVNPRSTGISSAQTYEKHTSELSLKPEALELARCRDLDIQTEHVKTVELINFDESTNRLTTRKVDGQELFHTVWNPTYLLGRLKGHQLDDPDVIRARIIEAGSWLRKYHESSASSLPEGPDGNWMEAEFCRKIEDIRKGRLIPEAKLARIEKKFGAELSKLSQPAYLEANNAFACRVHGDFVIYNILIDKQKNLHVLDFGETCISGNLDDVARFYSSLWAIAETNSTRRKLLGDLPARFLNAYGVSPEIVETPYFRCSLVHNFLTHFSGQFYMRDLLSWNSNREMSQITRAGIKWVYKQI